MQSGDGLVVLLVVVAFGFWFYAAMRKKMRETVEASPPLDWLNADAETEVPEDEATRLLDKHGYRVLAGKRRIPITIRADEAATLQSRLFIDYMAEKDGHYYAVKLAKERKPLERTGSSLRDRLLVYQLLDERTDGVLYVRLVEKQVECYRFSLMEADEEE
ncbi:hypothetical protein SAMN02799630_03416 [Paenibacillus sp. UNCCL117]|uniref:hypothetical protein n=1 Tax=unclassified Paenibacillus TaxID=185978 RepID=UPI000889075B|nr:MULTISPECIES: hypothetical protein [unclassified Paenibacillus]SDD44641.1 hypothetical protein SAMN04488602_108203 [Paenibacillus sp. cl123]SFW47085.1 hypothetical protein SAMN02799630_03416 [Paenibacillus sp. UNCCL117]